MTDSVLWMSPINPLAGTCKQSILESQWRLLHYCVLGKDEDFIQKYAKIIAGSKVSSIAIDKFFKKFLSLLVWDLPWNTSSTLKIWWNTLADSKKRERGLCSSRKIVMKNSPSMQIADNLNSQGWKCTKLYILNRVQGKKKKKKISDNLMLWNCSLANKFIQISQTFSLRFVSSLNRRFYKSWITHNTIMYSYFKDFVKYGLRFSFLLKCELL